MSLAVLAARRGAALALSRRAAGASPSLGRRFAHDEHHHDDHGHGHGPVDTNVYPPEQGFRAPIWRNVLILSVLGIAIAKYLPDDWRENNFFLRAWRHHGYVDPEVWKERNVKHLEQSVQMAKDKLLLEHAERPHKRIWGYQGHAHSGSPNMVGVGTDVRFDTSPPR
ncbi:hypothetical protein EXIGLDRAFT_729502 [Exidia glandulosa HHB12029]|uniref:Uncharacterized protein n=1 Tax=Exidia glandulosa HHB12029 TaxID=1314781 RepID=A0A165ZGQ9_EXIGL|nr:hypothetical protein EXIGLDRAFT_729502 [Exidia glandulosa HHB12029]